MIRTRVLDFPASAGSTVIGSISVPPGRYAGCYYTFTPDRGSADVTITNLGRSLLAKTNALNADGFQAAADPGQVINGLITVDVNQVQAGDVVHVTVYTDL